jgi:hypothetical protein
MKNINLAAATLLCLSSQAYALNHYPANHCELFIDQVTSWNSSHVSNGIAFYVKTLNDRLDSPIKQIAFHFQILKTPEAVAFCARSGSEHATDCDRFGVWQTVELSAYQGAQDYWQLGLVLKHDFTFEHKIEGVFYVETFKGNRYWVKAAGDSNFMIDMNLKRDIDRLRGHTAFGSDINEAIRTSDRLPYLNPTLCR